MTDRLPPAHRASRVVLGLCVLATLGGVVALVTVTGFAEALFSTGSEFAGDARGWWYETW